MIKLNKGEVQEATRDPLTIFREGIKSSSTLKKYERRLKIFLCHTLEDYLIGDPTLREKQHKEYLESDGGKQLQILDADFPDRVREFVEKTRKDPEWTMNVMLTYAQKLKERTRLPKEDPNYLNPQTFPNYFKSQKKLFKMNGVHFEWTRINAIFPELDNDNETRGYTREEISKTLEFATPIDRVIILLTSSSGIRRGGLEFTWDCIKPVYRRKNDLVVGNYDDADDSNLVCGMVDIYKKSAHHYIAFFTPETWNAIKNYRLQWMNDTLRSPKPDEPFLKKQGPLIQSLSCDAAANRIYKLLEKSKVRNQLSNGKRRHDVPVMNGYRRFFNKVNKETFSKDSPLGALIKKEMMLSHTGLIPLDKNYFQTQWKELVEEYLIAVPNLTIDDTIRLEEENILKERKIKELKNDNLRISNLESVVEELAKRLEFKSD